MSDMIDDLAQDQVASPTQSLENSVEPTDATRSTIAATAPLVNYVSPDVLQAEARARRRSMVIAIVALVASVAVGAAFNAVDDAAHGGAGHAAYAAFALGAAAAIALLAIGAGTLCRARAATLIASAILVLGAVFASLLLFEVTPLRHSIGWVRGDESVAKQAADSFGMRLYLCWTPSVIVGVASSMLSRRRREYIGFAAALATGLLSAVLWGAQSYGTRHRWLIPMKWPKFLSTGLMLLVLLLLCQQLAGAIDSFYRRRAISSVADPRQAV